MNKRGQFAKENFLGRADRLGFGLARLPANRALWIAPHANLGEPSALRVEREKTSDERIAIADDELQGLVCLNSSDDSREHAQDTGLASSGGQLRGRRLGIEASIAGALERHERRSHALETKDGAVHDGLP
jgi:hypothetical protein